MKKIKGVRRTFEVEPAGSLNPRAAEAAALNADGRPGYPRAVLPSVSEKKYFLRSHEPKTRPQRASSNPQ